MGYFSEVHIGRVLTVIDTNGNHTEVSREEAQTLADACAAFLARRTCTCGPDRKEIVEDVDSKTFYPRTGCTNCNLWDGPVRCR